jgi:serine phosphatase RsbU (regulator of sigma subunit)
MASALVSLFAGLSVHLLLTGNETISTISFKLFLVVLSYVFASVLKYSFSLPYFPKIVLLDVLIWILVIFSGFLVFSSIDSLGWNARGGILIRSTLFLGAIDGFRLYSLIYLFGLPALSVLALVARGIGIKSRIFRQRLMFVAASVIAGFLVGFLLFTLSGMYIWAFPLVPFGLVVLVVLVNQAVSNTTFLDRSRVFSVLVNFTVLGLVFSVVAALVSVFLIDAGFLSVALAIILVAGTVLLLALRDIAGNRLGRYIRIGTEYARDLEAGLDQLDYTSGGMEVIGKTAALLERYVECSSVEILVSDDRGKLVTVFSSKNTKSELLVENKAIDLLLNHNESLVLKTQAITKHEYAEVKADLLKILDIGDSDAFMLLREGRRVVGLIMLGAKKRGGDYTEYDYSVLSNLYSNFFLVMYYLKNIANESVVMTVDREIEFSGQIITSIQENIDRISHNKVDVDFVTKSARKLGGDFIDFIKLGEEKYLYVMGDVSGKGLNASMSMVILKSVLRTFLSETSDFKKLVVKVNGFIKNNLPKGTFFAGVFGLMDFTTNTMYYLNCGVPVIFLYTAAYNNAIEIQGEGKVLGFVRDIEKYLKVKKIVLNPQDIILMTTDGLVDSVNLRGERFGKDRVQRLLLDNRSYPAGRMAQFLTDNLSEFVSRELDDDVTVLVLKYLNK